MKVINVITSHFPPEITAAAHRIESFVDALSVEYHVNVFTLTERGHKSPERKVQISDNVIINYINLPAYPKLIFFIRAFYEIYYSFRLALRASRTLSDLTFVSSPFIFLIPFVSFFSRGQKKILDIRDLTWLYLPVRTFIQRIVKSVLISLVKRSVSLYDEVFVTNNWEKSWIEKNVRLYKGNVKIISNGISESRFRTLANANYSGSDQVFVVTYIGNLGDGQQLYSIIDAIRRNRLMRLNIIGDGMKLNELKKYVRDHSIQNVIIHGKLKWNRLLPFYTRTNLLYACLGKNYRSAIPSKLFEYLSTGLPILFNGGGESVTLLRNFENVFFIKSDKSERIEAMLDLIATQNPSRSEENILNIEQSFLRENINRRLIPLFDSISNRIPTPETRTERDQI